MYNNFKVGAVVVSAGRSRRMGNINKQFLMIGGKPVLSHTLALFESMPVVDFIVLVAGSGEVDNYREGIIDRYGISKVKYIVEGGEERQHSVRNGLEAIGGMCDIVIIHDGARPFADPCIIEKSVLEASEYGAAACGVPVKDTIKVRGSDGFITGSPDRSTLYAVQTPQTFRYQILYDAHKKALEEGFLGTDDTVLVERMGMKVRLFEGSYENIKITTFEDIYAAEAILRYRMDRQDGKLPGRD
jgi:2-C-methyl-D-erythritol 4-phosphate cytidylyltransferase